LIFSNSDAKLPGKAGTAHAQQEGVLEARLLHVIGNLFQRVNIGKLFFGDGEPAEPIALVRAGPERSILLPEARYFVVLFPVFRTQLPRPQVPFAICRFVC